MLFLYWKILSMWAQHTALLYPSTAKTNVIYLFIHWVNKMDSFNFVDFFFFLSKM